MATQLKAKAFTYELCFYQQLCNEGFYRWLKAFYAEFPGLTSNNTYPMGESYAGVYEFIRRLSR